MRILVLNHEYPPIGGGGGQACKNLADELVRRGHELTILTAHFRGLPREEGSPQLRIVRLPSLRKYPFKVGFLGMSVYILASIIQGLRTIRQWKPQMIHAHFAVPAGASAFVLHKLTGIPYILTVHLGDVPGAVPEKTDRWFRWIFPFTIPVWKNASKVIAVSDFTAALARDHYPIKPVVIPNGIPLDPYGGSPSPHQPPGIVFAGRFVPQKNLFVFLEILDSVRDLDWNCVMLGDGPLFDVVVARARELGLSDRISFPGWVNPEVLALYFEQADLLLMPSLSEGLSVVGVQALASGLAIFASNIGGFSGLVVNDQNGFLADVDDLSQFKKSTRVFLENPQMLLKARLLSKEMVCKFDIRSVADQYEMIFSHK
jgi:L-malate glycosyltransferase